jgi:hypothetical protein
MLRTLPYKVCFDKRKTLGHAPGYGSSKTSATDGHG